MALVASEGLADRYGGLIADLDAAARRASDAIGVPAEIALSLVGGSMFDRVVGLNTIQAMVLAALETTTEELAGSDLEEIVVAETTPVVDPEQTSTGQVFTAEYLKKASIGLQGAPAAVFQVPGTEGPLHHGLADPPEIETQEGK